MFPFSVLADSGNATNNSFNKAKKMLEKQVYMSALERKTIYCEAQFDTKKKVTAPAGFQTDKYKKRAKKIEWEHVVPAENFGRTFDEWRQGNALCVNSKGNSFKGRRCAEKVNGEYQLMQADMYNLFPAIGAVNASRSNYNFVMLTEQKSSFGSCAMKIAAKKAEPPQSARGQIARTYLYMASVYPRYKMSKQQYRLMSVWHRQYPVSDWECLRAERIALLQGNLNQVLIKSCSEAGYSI
ncbi:endonuclease [Psychromonas ossibalaenae]|uniref:endonuclease n=1 Tax=Psychromonas ossibalaenae TaxID=444922 RepID=UPI00035F6235